MMVFAVLNNHVIYAIKEGDLLQGNGELRVINVYMENAIVSSEKRELAIGPMGFAFIQDTLTNVDS